MGGYPRVWVEIALGALGRNLQRIRSAIGPPPPALALVAKADAYGHGLGPIARHAVQNGADWLAVAAVSEGVALRDAGLECPVLTLSPILPEEAEQAVFYGLDASVESLEVAEALSQAAVRQGRSARLHLKVDTGLNRFGAKPHQAVERAAAIMRLPGIELAGLSQHFIDSATRPDLSAQQWSHFRQVVEECRAMGFSGMAHGANSAAALRIPESRQDLIRVGLAAYGVDPHGLLNGAAEPVMRMKARVLSMRRAEAGETVGYNATHTLERAATIATLGAGYGDGIPRAMSGKGFVEAHGQRLPIVGLICMDQMMIDATAAPELSLGDAVEIFGERISASECAAWAGTNSHEILTRIMPRAPRRYLQ
jgi:alanine racemase